MHGELIEGKYPFLYIDFPRYGFDENTGTLYAGGGYSKLDLEVDETLKVVYGHGQDLSGCAGSGIATGLQGVYELPYESDKLKIVEIGLDGTAHLEYNNVSIVLKSGEKWSNAESTIETKQSDGKTAKARITTTDTIMNYGILDKSKIG